MTFPSLKPENADPAKNNDNLSARQKRASFQSGTNRAFLIPEKTSKEITEMKDKIASAKSIEIRCASAATRSPIDKGTILARSSSTTSLEKTRRTNSAPPQRRNLGPAAPGTRVQVNIVIDAPGLTEATDKSTICGKMQSEKDAVEKIEESSTKVGSYPCSKILQSTCLRIYRNLFITLRTLIKNRYINYMQRYIKEYI